VNKGADVDNRVLALIDVVTEGWSKCLPKPYGDESFMPAGDVTHCNQYVHFVATKLGYTKFQPDGKPLLMANEMFDLLNTNTDEWISVGSGVAQWHANNGGLVVAAWKNPDGGHCRVSIVFPGELGSSGNWNSDQVPRMANVGPAERCKIGIGANWCFHDVPKFYALKATL
jgi:hypothetical protein